MKLIQTITKFYIDNSLMIATTVIIGFFTILGYKKGASKLLYPFLKIILCLFLAHILLSPTCSFLKKHTPIYKKIQHHCKSSKKLKFKKNSSNIEEQQQFIKNSKVPNIIKKDIIRNNTYKTYKKLKINTFKEYLVLYISNLIIKIIAYIFILIFLIIACKVLKKILHLTNKVAVIKSCNRFLGLIIGFCFGLIIMWLLFILLSTEIQNKYTITKNMFNMNNVKEYYLLKTIYYNNIFLKTILMK